MKKTILILGIACASVMAVAQSEARQDQHEQTTNVATPRDQATGQASGKRMHKPMTLSESADASAQVAVSPRDHGTGQASGDVMVRESPSKASLGRTMAADNSQPQQKGMSGAQSTPMYKDSKNSGTNPLFESKDRVAGGKSNYDGDPDRPVVVKSKSNITNNRAADDVNGDGHADLAASANAQAEMKGDLSRGHQPDRKAGNGSVSARDHTSGQTSGKRQHD